MDGVVLVADDDRTIRTVLTQAYTRAGCKVHATSSLTTLLRWVKEGKGDLVVSDVVMPDGNGIENLHKISALRPNLPVIIISAQNTIMTAIKANEAAAFDYLPKPFDLPDLMARSSKALAIKSKLSGTLATVANAHESEIVGRTDVMQVLYRLIASVVNSQLPMLVLGESGVGKTLVAKTIHQLADRADSPLIVLSEDDFSDKSKVISKLESAKGGTLLIEDVDEYLEESQRLLVRTLKQSEVQNLNLICTSQTDLAAAERAGAFRSDLYYRICGVEIPVPSLRDRVEDIALLCDVFSEQIASQNGKRREFDAEAIQYIRQFTWPGNVRQLKNTISRLHLGGSQTAISKDEVWAVLGKVGQHQQKFANDVDEKLSAAVDRHLRRYFELHGGELPPKGVYQRIFKEVEQPMIAIALEATGGNQAKCADLLGINRNTLRKKITELDLVVTRGRKMM